MKIRITESQYSKLISEEKGNPYNGIKSKNGLVSVYDLEVFKNDKKIPLKNLILDTSTKYSFYLYFNCLAKSNSLVIIENVTFSKEGAEVENLPQKPLKSGEMGLIVFKVKPKNYDKTKSFVRLTVTVNIRLANSKVRDVLEIPINYTVDTLDSKLESCKSKYNNQELKKASDWYKNWLSNPITKSKFGKNFKYDNKKVEEIFKTYFYILNQLKTEYVFSNRPNGAWVQPHLNRLSIKINCSIMGDGVFETFIHEIQHLLDSQHKLHPYEENIWNIFSFLSKNEPSQFSSKNDDTLEKLLKNEGFQDIDISTLLWDYNWKLENDKLHLEDPNEMMSSFYEVRTVLNLKPGQQITKKMLVDKVYSPDIRHFLCQWIYSKMTLHDWLNYFNSVALNKNNQNNPLV